MTVIKTGTVPAALLAASVVVLAPVDATERNGTVVGFPGTVTGNNLLLVALRNNQAKGELRRSEGSGELGVTPARHMVHAVAQHHAEHVLARFQMAGNVKANVVTRLRIVGPGRVEKVVADFLAIDRQFEMPQATDRHLRGRDRRVLQDKGLAKNRQRRVRSDRRMAASVHVHTRHPLRGRLPLACGNPFRLRDGDGSFLVGPDVLQ